MRFFKRQTNAGMRNGYESKQALIVCAPIHFIWNEKSLVNVNTKRRQRRFITDNLLHCKEEE